MSKDNIRIWVPSCICSTKDTLRHTKYSQNSPEKVVSSFSQDFPGFSSCAMRIVYILKECLGAYLRVNICEVGEGAGGRSDRQQCRSEPPESGDNAVFHVLTGSVSSFTPLWLNKTHPQRWCRFLVWCQPREPHITYYSQKLPGWLRCTVRDRDPQPHCWNIPMQDTFLKPDENMCQGSFVSYEALEVSPMINFREQGQKSFWNKTSGMPCRAVYYRHRPSPSVAVVGGDKWAPCSAHSRPGSLHPYWWRWLRDPSMA